MGDATPEGGLRVLRSVRPSRPVDLAGPPLTFPAANGSVVHWAHAISADRLDATKPIGHPEHDMRVPALAVALLLLGCSGGSRDARAATCRTLAGGLNQLHENGRSESKPPPQDLVDARSRALDHRDDFGEAVQEVADRYIVIARVGVTGPLSSDASDRLRSATALVEKQCADAGVPIDVDRPFGSQ